jgi:hypothetical protein
VSAWIYSVAGDILTKRERLLQEIERLGTEGLPVPSTDPSAGGSVHGSITDSDTFQRIQSWAEREAARAADLPSRPSIELDEGASDAVETVADARVESLSFPPPVPTAAASAAPRTRELLDGALAVPLSDEEIGFEQLDDEPTSKAALQFADVASAEPMAPIFSHAPRPQSEAARRRQRRVLTLLSAAGVLGLLTLVAVIAVQPVALMRASGALRPETSATTASRAAAAPVAAVSAAAAVAPAERPAAASPATSPTTVPARASEQPGAPLASKGRQGAGDDSPSITRVAAPAGLHTLEPATASARPAALGTSPASAAASSALAGSPVAASRPVSPAGSTADASFNEGAANRTSLALAASKVGPPGTPKRATKSQPVAHRARAAAAAPRATPPAAASAAVNKLDCQQPFWIDEKGIRRLKMACL